MKNIGKSVPWHGRLQTLLLTGLLALVPFVAVPRLSAQSQSGPIEPKPSQTVQRPLDQNPIRVRVDLITTPVVVQDSKGDLVLDLEQKNFRIFDNGVLEKIEDFDIGGEPISAAIVMETSSRIEPLLPAIRRTGVLFTQTVLGQGGDATIIGYDDHVSSLLGFTEDRDAIEKTIANLKPGQSGARLYEALAKAVDALRNRPAGRRRVIVTVAEAVDTGSEEKLGEVLREAQLANITVYAVGLSSTSAQVRNGPTTTAMPPATPPGTFGLPPIPGTAQTPTTEENRNNGADLMALAVWVVQHVDDVVRQRPLEIATTGTGGLYISTLKDSQIESAVDQIGGELHAQYTLSYRPTGTDPGGYHEIRVEVVDSRNLKIRARPGYYLGPPKG